MSRRETAFLWYGSVLGGGTARAIDHADEGAVAFVANLLVTAAGLGLVWLYEHFRVVRADK